MQPFCIPLPESSPLEMLFKMLEKESAGQQFMAESASLSWLQLILIEIMRYANNQQLTTSYRSTDVNVFNQFNVLIEENYRSHWALPQYAEQIGLTTSRLNDICRRVSGLSSKRLITDRIMQEARRMLLLTAMSISEVGYELGFTDPAYFARFFRKNAGITASAFRDKSQEK